MGHSLPYQTHTFALVRVKIEFKRKEMEKQSELQREELKTRKKELDDKRNQNEAMHQQMMMQQQQSQLSTIMMSLLALAAKK